MKGTLNSLKKAHCAHKCTVLYTPAKFSKFHAKVIKVMANKIYTLLGICSSNVNPSHSIRENSPIQSNPLKRISVKGISRLIE